MMRPLAKGIKMRSLMKPMFSLRGTLNSLIQLWLLELGRLVLHLP